MCHWVCELVFLIVPAFYIDENAEIVGPWSDSDAGSSELGTQLVKPTCADAFNGAVDEKGRNWGVMGGLLGNVRYPNWSILGFNMPCG